MGAYSLPSRKRKEHDQPSSLPFPNSKNPKLDALKPEECAKDSNFEEKLYTQTLLQQKKLVLLLDLDHTLLNSANYKELSLNEDYLLYTHHDVKISLWQDYIIKLRPYVHTFLLEASKLFDLYICTMATHDYALQIAELLDPQGVYFNSSKIMSRGDFKVEDQKDLSLVLGEERIVVILDDSVQVWKGYKDSLIVMSRYNYFAASHNLYEVGYSLCEMKEDEDEVDGALALTLSVLRRIHDVFFEGCYRDVRKIMKMIGDEVENGKFMDDQRWVVGVI